ncbi:MAG: Lon-like protease helical domain-containing protein, partial [Alphaproteobacteria bacterium]
MAVTALPPERLARRTDPATLDFRSTAELEGWADALGQERALEALKFGLGIRREGYNLFGFGPSGLGKHHMVQTFAERQAAREPAPSDWCYVHNFAEPHKPNAIKLPPGRGRPLRDDMARLIDEMRAALPAAFESDDYRAQRQAIEDQLKARHQDAFGALQEKAKAKNIALIRTPMGPALAPVREGEVLGPEEFERLTEKEQRETQRDLAELQEELQAIMRQAPQWEREHRRQVREL